MPVRREYPDAPIVSVGVMVRRGDRVLLVQRGHAPSYGRWSLPGGVVELGESIREAARREVREECGIEIEPGAVISVFEPIWRDDAGRVQYHYVVIDLLADYQGGEVRVGSDSLDARWVGARDLDTLDVTKSAAELVRRVLSQPGESGVSSQVSGIRYQQSDVSSQPSGDN